MLRFAEAFWKICENEVSSHDDIGHLLWPSVECGRSGGMPLDLRCEECKTLEERLEEAVTGLVLEVPKVTSLYQTVSRVGIRWIHLHLWEFQQTGLGKGPTLCFHVGPSPGSQSLNDSPGAYPEASDEAQKMERVLRLQPSTFVMGLRFVSARRKIEQEMKEPP